MIRRCKECRVVLLEHERGICTECREYDEKYNPRRDLNNPGYPPEEAEGDMSDLREDDYGPGS